APGSDLLSDLDRVLDRGAEAVRVPHGKRHGVASRLGVDVADPLPPCDLAVAERPPERHDRAAGLPAPGAAEGDLGVRRRAGWREGEHGVGVVDAGLVWVDGAWLLAARREER